MNELNVQPPEKDLIDLYFELLDEVHDFFKYKQDWTVIPMEDYRHMFWTLYENSDGSGTVRYHEEMDTLQDFDAGGFYEAPIYTQRFLPKWIYKTEKYTMISIDTLTDGNKLLAIFDNSKEVKDPEPYREWEYKIPKRGTGVEM